MILIMYILPHQTFTLDYLWTYGLETCYSYLGSIKHTYISMVKQTIATSYIVQSFFFFLLRGAQFRILNYNNKKW